MKKLKLRVVHETEKGALVEVLERRQIVSKESDLYKVVKATEAIGCKKKKPR